MKSNQTNWEWKKLGEICDVRDGTHNSPKYVKEGYPLITSKNLSKGVIDFSEINLISEEDFVKVNKRSKVDKGDIIMPMIGTIGNPIIVETEKQFAIKNVALIKFNDDKVINKYIRFLLNSPYFNDITSKSKRGGTQKFISLGDIRNFVIPLPPSSVQKQTIVILERAEKLKEKRKQANEKADKIIQSIFYEMFGDPFDKSSNSKKLCEISDITMGQSPPGESYNEVGKGIPFFQGRTEFGEKYTSVKKYTTHPTKLAKKGDILMSVRAPVGTVNISCVDCCIGRGLASIRSTKINKDFLYTYLRLIESKIINLGSGSTFQAITTKQLRDLPITIPSVELQSQFASIVEKIESIKEKQNQTTGEINTLFDALMQKAFNGKLVS